MFLGGHSGRVGVTLNSLSYSENYVKGYVFLAPDFGINSNTGRVSRASNFATLCQRAFIVNAISHGLLLGHEPAVRFAYTPEEVKAGGDCAWPKSPGYLSEWCLPHRTLDYDYGHASFVVSSVIPVRVGQLLATCDIIFLETTRS